MIKKIKDEDKKEREGIKRVFYSSIYPFLNHTFYFKKNSKIRTKKKTKLIIYKLKNYKK